MTLNANIAEDVQKPNPGELVELFELDTTIVGGPIYRFTASQHEEAYVVYNGNTYYRLDVKATGFEFTGKGQLPRPTLSVGLIGAGAGAAFRSAIRQYQDLVGCSVTRRRTFRRYLDGQEAASWAAQLPPDLYVIERKIGSIEGLMVEFELSALMDFEGKLIPGRQVIRDVCTRTYRIWNGSSFDAGTCPYTAARYYDSDGEIVVDPEEDDCGRKLSDCKLRFRNPLVPVNEPLPTYAFPGAGKVRLR